MKPQTCMSQGHGPIGIAVQTGPAIRPEWLTGAYEKGGDIPAVCGTRGGRATVCCNGLCQHIKSVALPSLPHSSATAHSAIHQSIKTISKLYSFLGLLHGTNPSQTVGLVQSSSRDLADHL
jgi:hypothetical protein